MMFNWIARNSKENESEQETTILSVAYVINGIQLNSQYHNSIEYKFSEPNFFLMLYVFVPPGNFSGSNNLNKTSLTLVTSVVFNIAAIYPPFF